MNADALFECERPSAVKSEQTSLDQAAFSNSEYHSIIDHLPILLQEMYRIIPSHSIPENAWRASQPAAVPIAAYVGISSEGIANYRGERNSRHSIRRESACPYSTRAAWLLVRYIIAGARESHLFCRLALLFAINLIISASY